MRVSVRMAMIVIMAVMIVMVVSLCGGEPCLLSGAPAAPDGAQLIREEP